MAKTKTALARVLVDIVAHGAKAGQIIEADPKLIKDLEAQGSVDPHADAVAHARREGQKVVRVAAEVAQDDGQAAAAKTALEAELSALEQQRDAADASDLRQQLQAQIDAKRAELTQL